MSVRKIIEIDESKCDGCGRCVEACAEGAIEIIDGKAKVIRDSFCDGLGACLGECPQDALHIIEREADPFDEEAAMAHATARKGASCPSASAMVLQPMEIMGSSGKSGSELTNWPIQMRLVNAQAPYFNGARLLLAGDCTAFAFATMHPDLIRGRVTVIGCPKLDDREEYVSKLADILSGNDIKDITIVHMEVPCCSGLRNLIETASKRAGVAAPVRTYIVRRTGELIESPVKGAMHPTHG